jgi:RNA polymerase sigma-70 factor (ECF subfamily)
LESSIAQLVQRAQQGDSEAYCRLIRHFEKPALSLAFGVLSDASAAGDVVQEAFLQAWRKLGDLRDPDRFAGWVMQMVRNRAIDRTRIKAALSLDPAIDVTATETGPPGTLEARELRSRIDLALEQLDDVTRQAVAMRYFENRSSREIAEQLDLSPAAIDMRLSRARQQLREMLSDLGSV